MEETEVLIIGQGLAGTWLSWWLEQEGISYKIIDRINPNGASLRAAGLINPVTGRRIVTTWMIDELIPFAKKAYREIGDFLKQSVIRETSTIDFFPSIQMLQAFQERYEQDRTYLLPGSDREKYAPWFHYDLGWGAIHPCLLVDVENLLTLWRSWLNKNKKLADEVYDPAKLILKSKGVQYADIHARYILFCDGIGSVQNPYFEKLPFAPNKGEGLLVEIKGIPADFVYKKGMSLVPCRENIFWLGSSYEWSFKDDRPSESFRKNAESWLSQNLKIPFTVLDHFASVRPATLERRPFVGLHPHFLQLGILNGLGTKGCSLAPYFAKELAQKLSGKGSVNPLADIQRFSKILGKPKY